MSKISFVGLGVMGSPITRHLALAGHEVTIFNRTRARIDAWLDKHRPLGIDARIANSPAEAARDADAVLTCVGNDDDLADVVMGPDGVFAGLKRGGIFIDHTTVSAKIARQLAVEGKPKGILCVDAPLTGGQAGAENGTLSIMCGGSEEAFNAASEVMQAYAARIVHIGKAGSGQLAKMVNQICIAGVLGGLSEGIRFAQASHLDLDKVYEAISGGAAQSWQMNNRWATMVKDEFDFGFAVDWMRKDLGLGLDEARSSGATLPVTALVDQFYADVQALGGGRNDTSALIRRLPRKAPRA